MRCMNEVVRGPHNDAPVIVTAAVSRTIGERPEGVLCSFLIRFDILK
jgi:hypothetical protein